MESEKRQANLLSLMKALRERGSWCGETHIQKCTYFLQEGLGVPLGFEFVLYKHGPFSFDLREGLGEMRANLVIGVKPQPPYGPSLEPGPSSEAVMERFPRTREQYAKQIDFVANKLAERNVVDLERLGTALYVTKENPGSDAAARARLIHELKPHISEQAARDTVEQVDELLQQAQAEGVMLA